ncbi:MAG: alpha/beta hydrolase [Myxococcales bacterium]|nr:alpha/beta hydrolase [Myxococcales bacterium]HRC56502.1 alpha/beta hydrolase [Kofleriaceae bacterium]
MASLRVDGVTLEVAWYDARGRRSAGRSSTGRPTLVLLHEGLGSVSSWRDWPATLARAAEADVLLWSRAGYGGSDGTALPRPLDYMEREGRDVVPRVLEVAQVHRAVLVGHSDGGSISLVYAATGGRDQVAGLALLAPHVICEDVTVAAIARARRAYLEGDLRAKLARHHGDNTDVAFWGWNDAWLDPGFRAFDLTGYLPQVTAPVVVIQGECDPYGTLAQVELIERGVSGPVRRVVLPEVGHAPQRERPAETAQAVVALLGQVG